MKKLRIYVDFAAPSDALELLQQNTTEHQLVFARTPDASDLDGTERDPQLSGLDVAFGQPDPLVLAHASQLKWIQISSSGITRYDTPSFRALAAERSLQLCNSASVYQEACAVQALSFMLAQARMLPLALKTRIAKGTPTWRELRSSCSTLRRTTVLILGFGAIGKRLVELLQPFDVRIIAYRRKARGDEGVRVITETQLADALANQVDHVVDILPESEETRGFFDDARFSMIKPGAVFYNIGRGATVDQNALLRALRSGRVRAAWLDVTDPEPLPDEHLLRSEPNCFITPHIAGGHPEESKSLVRHFLSNLDRFVHGQPLVDQVIRESGGGAMSQE